MSLTVLRADARSLPIPDDSVDLILTSPPYFGLRSYQDGGVHYPGQVGAEATPAEFVDALIEVTRECVRVLKPTGSLWVNLGDKYAAGHGGSSTEGKGVNINVGHAPSNNFRERPDLPNAPASWGKRDASGRAIVPGFRPKTLMGMPWRYALRCIDDLGLILRAEVIWAKPNGLPESVTDRVRRSHETWFHFVLNPRYFSAVDEIREAHNSVTWIGREKQERANSDRNDGGKMANTANPLGKLPGFVWTVATEPLRVPEHLGVDHFAAFPSEFPKRIIAGWSPGGVCVECGEGRRPVPGKAPWWEEYKAEHGLGDYMADGKKDIQALGARRSQTTTAIPTGPKTVITGYSCACPQPTADTTPAVILDPFGGTGTTAHVAHALGRHGISVDLSADYCRLASAPELIDQRMRKVLGVEKATPQVTGQGDLFGGDAA